MMRVSVGVQQELTGTTPTLQDILESVRRTVSIMSIIPRTWQAQSLNPCGLKDSTDSLVTILGIVTHTTLVTDLQPKLIRSLLQF